MIKAEPKTILHFIWNNFDLVRDLFEIQSNDDIIRKEKFTIVSEGQDSNILPKLLDYKILREVNDDYEFQDVYYKLLEFLLFEFKPLLPEEIEKYGVSISDLFRNIREGINGEKNILIDRIRALSLQVREFIESIEKSTIRLLKESRDLKANVDKIEHVEKIRRATYWIENYITPLNTVLDNNHSESISNKLLDISDYVNQRRLDFKDESIRQQFEKLYFQLSQAIPNLIRHSKILTNELLPLIERIRTEFSIMTGWIEFLQGELFRKKLEVPVPKLMKSERYFAYSNSIFLNSREYFDQYAQVDDVFIMEDQTDYHQWLFDRSHYKGRLINSLPVHDFFHWCEEILLEEYDSFTNVQFLSLTSLLFEEDFSIGFHHDGEKSTIKTDSSEFQVPKLHVVANEIY